MRIQQRIKLPVFKQSPPHAHVLCPGMSGGDGLSGRLQAAGAASACHPHAGQRRASAGRGNVIPALKEAA
jgi:hypothetical protein